MAESEAKHVQSMDKGALDATREERKRGQWMGLIVSLAAFICAAYCASQGQGAAASIIGGTTVVGLVSAFVLGRRSPVPDDDDD